MSHCQFRKVQCRIGVVWEGFRRYSTIRPAVLTESTGPLRLTVWPGYVSCWDFFLLNGVCMPATAKASLLQLSSIVAFSLVGSSSLCLLNLTRHHWQSGTQPHMSHVLGSGLAPAFVWGIPLPFVRSHTVWLGGKLFTDMCGSMCVKLLAFRVVFSAARFKFPNTVCLPGAEENASTWTHPKGVQVQFCFCKHAKV